MSFCNKCGAKVPEDAEYCHNCGAKIFREGTATSTIPTSSEGMSSAFLNYERRPNLTIYRVITGIGFLILLLSATTPWLIALFLPLSLVNIYNMLIHYSGSNLNGIGQATNPFSAIPGALFAAILLYPIAVVLAGISIISKKVSVVAGIFAIMSSLLWIFGVQSAQTSSEGSLGSALSLMTFVGYGAYLPLLAGIILLVAFFYIRKTQKVVL